MAFDTFLHVSNNYLKYSFFVPFKNINLQKKIKGNEFSEMTDCFVVILFQWLKKFGDYKNNILLLLLSFAWTAIPHLGWPK